MLVIGNIAKIISSMQKKSLKQGFKGLEVDVFWDNGNFYLSHGFKKK